MNAKVATLERVKKGCATNLKLQVTTRGPSLLRAVVDNLCATCVPNPRDDNQHKDTSRHGLICMKLGTSREVSPRRNNIVLGGFFAVHEKENCVVPTRFGSDRGLRGRRCCRPDGFYYLESQRLASSYVGVVGRCPPSPQLP